MSLSDICVYVLHALDGRQFNITMDIDATGYNKFDVKKNGFRPAWIVIHHSWSPDRDKYNDWEGIKTFHTSWRFNGDIVTPERAQELKAEGKTVVEPWHKVGYQFGIEKVNNKIEVFTGREIGEVGAHAIGFNAKSIGICLIGNYDIAPPDVDRFFVLASLCRQLQREFNIPKECVIGHRDTFTLLNEPVQKSCPGKMFDLAIFRERLLDVSPA